MYFFFPKDLLSTLQNKMEIVKTVERYSGRAYHTRLMSSGPTLVQ